MYLVLFIDAPFKYKKLNLPIVNKTNVCEIL